MIVEENKTLKEQIIKKTKDTLESSSIHAIPNIVRSKSKALRLIWVAFLLLSICACGRYLFQSISSYLDHETITKLEVKNVNQLQFPVISICDLKSFFDKQSYKGICLGSINRALFLEKELIKENEFEAYKDPSYGNCLRFNSGKNMNGSKIETKTVNNNGMVNSLHLYLDPNIHPVIWITNEIVDSTQEPRTLLSNNPYVDIKIKKQTIIKEPQPYSSCLADLTSADSYPSDCYAKTFNAYDINYRYTDCINMCKQKYLGEKCQFQSDLYGPKYFTNMDYFGYNNIYYDSNDDKKECFAKSSNTPSDYLENCNCPLECKSDEFTFDISTSNFGKFREVIIFYDQMKETVITEEPKTSLADLISTLGGIIGLFSGASFLSVIELVEIGVLVAIIYSDDKKKRSTIEPNNHQNIGYANRDEQRNDQPENRNEEVEMNQNMGAEGPQILRTHNKVRFSLYSVVFFKFFKNSNQRSN